jgi:hypothetical protein
MVPAQTLLNQEWISLLDQAIRFLLWCGFLLIALCILPCTACALENGWHHVAAARKRRLDKQRPSLAAFSDLAGTEEVSRNG